MARYVPFPELMSVITQGLQRSNPSSVQSALKVLEAFNSFGRLSYFILLRTSLPVVHLPWSAKSEGPWITTAASG